MYIRTYSYLIKHESDFERGCDSPARLIPARVTWEQFSQFSELLNDIADHQVSGRYTYGELRLSRLSSYFEFGRGNSTSIGRTPSMRPTSPGITPRSIFVSGIVSVVLGTLQVEFSIEQVTATPAHGVGTASRRFGVIVIGLLCMLVLVLAALWTYKAVAEWYFAIKCPIRKSTQVGQGPQDCSELATVAEYCSYRRRVVQYVAGPDRNLNGGQC
jgi:hypothetical protein